MWGTVLICALLLLLVSYLVLKVLYRPLAAPKNLSLSGLHVVITGGSSGIGRSVAAICAKKQAIITIIARDQIKLKETKEELLKLNANVHTISADVSSVEDIQRAMRESVEVAGKEIDILICSAGATNPLNFEQLDISDFDKVMKINFLGSVNCVKAVLPSMKKRNFGRIVFVSSQVGQVGMFGYTAYAPTKFAIKGFAESLYPEVKPYNVHISVSYPPDTDTPMYEMEMKQKPIETKLMSQSGSVFTPQRIAEEIVKGIEKWQFTISHGFDGKVLAILSGLLAPPSSILGALVEAFAVGILRLVWVFAILSGWYKIALTQHKVRENK